MRTEHELRSALRMLEQEAPATERVLRHVTERAGHRTAGPGRRPGRRLIAGVAAAAAVIGIVVAVTRVTPPSRVTPTPREALQSIPPYYMALVTVSTSPLSGDKRVISFSPNYAVVRDTSTGRILATVQPPKGYDMFDWVSAADDDRTFVLGAQSLDTDEETQPETFYEARFNPASATVTLTSLTLPGLPIIDDMAAAALSPDGTQLAVASDNGPTQITVYTLPSGTAKTWTAPPSNTPGSFGDTDTDILTWSSTGLLAYGWTSPFSEYLLNPNNPAGQLLPDSRRVLCLGGSVSGFEEGYYNGYLTPDGTTIIAPVAHSVPVGQDPPSCQTPSGPQPTPSGGPPALEEFSATTGQATSIIYTRQPDGITLNSTIWWTNSSGSVLVMEGSTGTGKNARQVEGVFTGGAFFPIPGTSGGVAFPAPGKPVPPYVDQLAF